jgi:hypothetical protein
MVSVGQSPTLPTRPSGAWRGPRDAADAYVEEADLRALGGLAAAVEAGARTLIATTADGAAAGTAAGLRVWLRVPYRAGEPEAERLARFEGVGRLGVAAVVPTPVGEPLGLDTLGMTALARLRAGVAHVVADFVLLGHRLAQMCLGFGADELFGPIVSERALRLGDNANNPAMTRKEAATLIRGAGLAPYERVSGGVVQEYLP